MREEQTMNRDDQPLIIDEEFANLIAPLRPSELAALESSILAEGCREPLIVWNGIIVDGHNRYAICTEHGIPFGVRQMNFESEAAAKEWMLTNQLARRNLSEPDRIELNLAREDLRARRGRPPSGAGEKIGIDGPISSESPDARKTAQKVAKAAGTSREKVRKHRRIMASPIGPELLDAIRDGTETYHGADRKVKKLLEKEAKERRKREALEKVSALALDERLILRHGDFCEVLNDLPDSSVDLILTDPPYALEYLELWNKLGEVAFRLLKDGGLLLAYAGNEKVCNKNARLEASGLAEYCQLYIPLSLRQWLGNRQIGVKPVLALSKGRPREHEKFFALVPTNGKVDKDAKEYHEWGQPLDEARYLVKKFSSAGDLVVDPMCGSATVPIAAYLEGRRGLGCEVDKAAYLEERRRITELLPEFR